MIRAVRNVMLVGAVVTVVACAVPTSASALDLGTICSLTGLVSTLAGKACTAASHAGRVVSAGGELITGHVGGALKAISGGSKVVKAATATVGLAAIVTAVVGGARYLLHETAAVIGSTTRPNLDNSWFSASYWRMAGVSALLTLPFLFAAAIQAMMRSDLAMLGRAAFGYLPLGLLAVAVAAPVTMLLLAGSDEMSTIISSASGHAEASFLDRAQGLLGGTVVVLNPFVGFFVGILTAAATITLWIELLIRDAAIYVIVLMLPLFFAAMVWPARRIWAIRTVELLVALILSKFAIVAVLSLGGSALAHTFESGPASAFAGATLVLLAAFTPWALLRLLPLHELASAAAGGMRPHASLMTSDERAHGATDRAEAGADEPPAGQDARREVTRANADYGATNGTTPPEDVVSAGPGVVTGGVSGTSAAGASTVAAGDPGAVAAAGATTPLVGAPSANGRAQSPPQAGPQEVTPVEANGEERAPGMDARWQVPDEELPAITFGRTDSPSPRSTAAPEAAPEALGPVPEEPTAEDHDPRPPSQEPDEGRL